MSITDPFIGPLAQMLERWNIEPGRDRLELLRRHFNLVLDANRRFNLTRITDPATASVRLYADSAAVVGWARLHQSAPDRVLDVGTGAGFPAIPMAVLEPAWSVTTIDGRAKKAAFVENSARALGLENLTALHAHSDHWVPDRTFDLVTFKAVGDAASCLRAAKSLTAPGKHVLVFETAAAVSASTTEAAECGFCAELPFEYGLPDPGGTARFRLSVFRRLGE